MFSDYSKELLRSGIIELKAGNREAARRYLDRAVYMSGDHEVMAEAWYRLSQITEDVAEKRAALENCLAHDLQHTRARRALAIVDGKLKPEDVVDANALPPPTAGGESEVQRFMCTKCGGRLVYAPDGRTLVCEYCRRHRAVEAPAGGPRDADFIVAMATRRAHDRPLREQVLECQGCGAQYILPPEQLSYVCAYCESPYVVLVPPSRGLISPEGIIPHAFDQKHAGDVLRDWLDASKLDPDKRPGPLRGLYLPAWSYVLGGEIDYRGERVIDDRNLLGLREQHTVQVQDRYPVMLQVSVAASRRASAPFVQLLPNFEMGGVQSYDARYLAAWPAELYDVPMSEASLEARSQAYAGLKRDLPTLLDPVRVLSTSSANLTIESFRLDLLPVWMIEVSFDGEPRLLLIDGQKGHVAGAGFRRSPESRRHLLAWLGDLLED